MKKNKILINNHTNTPGRHLWWLGAEDARNTKTGAIIVKSLPTAASESIKRGMEKKEIKENVIPTIFKQNVKNNLKVRPFNDMISDVGDIQYFPA